MDHSYIASRNAEQHSYSGKEFQFLTLSVPLPQGPAIAFLDVYCILGCLLQRNKTYVYLKTYTQMCLAALFIIGPNWTQVSMFLKV